MGPIGVIVPYGGASAPSKWLLCYGQNVSRTTYAGLFAILGTAFGAGDGSTTFGIPDMRGRVPAGKDNMGGGNTYRLWSQMSGSTLGASGGEEYHYLTAAEMPSHTHSTVAWGYFNAYVYPQAINAMQNYGGGYTTTGAAGSGGSHNNLQPTLITNYIIYAGV